jgi:hypothetical protein
MSIGGGYRIKSLVSQGIPSPLAGNCHTPAVGRLLRGIKIVPNCKASRNIKDYRTRKIDTVFGRVPIETPRYDQCRVCETKRGVVSPLKELIRGRVLPELEHLQAKLAADLPYRKAARLLREILPISGGLNSFVHDSTLFPRHAKYFSLLPFTFLSR